MRSCDDEVCTVQRSVLVRAVRGEGGWLSSVFLLALTKPVCLPRDTEQLQPFLWET